MVLQERVRAALVPDLLYLRALFVVWEIFMDRDADQRQLRRRRRGRGKRRRRRRRRSCPSMVSENCLLESDDSERQG
eukprot:759721-Hanusia_phi.AAC.2